MPHKNRKISPDLRGTRVETGKVGNTGKHYVRYRSPSGKEKIHVGGSKAWRNNNPGNIGCSDDVKTYLHSIGCDDEGRSIFPDWETGKIAMESLLGEWSAYKNDPIASAIMRYTRDDSPETQANYKKHIEERVRESIQRELDSDSSLSNEEKDRIAKEETDKIMNGTPLGSLDDKSFNTVTDAMKEFEQTTPGTEIDVTDDGTNKAYLTRTPIGVDENKHYPDPSEVDHNISLSNDPPIIPTDVKDVTNKPRDKPSSNQDSTTNPQGGDGGTTPRTMPDAQPSMNPPDTKPKPNLSPYFPGGKVPINPSGTGSTKGDVIDQLLHGYPQEAKDKARAEARQRAEKKSHSSSSHSGETLEYQDGKVWRIEADGSRRGFVKAWSK